MRFTQRSLIIALTAVMGLLLFDFVTENAILIINGAIHNTNTYKANVEIPNFISTMSIRELNLLKVGIYCSNIIFNFSICYLVLVYTGNITLKSPLLVAFIVLSSVIFLLFLLKSNSLALNELFQVFVRLARRPLAYSLFVILLTIMELRSNQMS